MSEHRYTAFISYRRTGRDLAVAKEIQQSLEHFKIPKALRGKIGADSIGRIFRDQSEMEITSNLSGQLMGALKDSDYLIVICSPHYKESPWCMRELKTFLQLRGHEKVLCVLSEGDPPSVFPDCLLHVSKQATAQDGKTITVEEETEPLACDYRGDFRSARRTELPRLAAAILGCSYDELYMRQERWRRRRLAAVLSTVSVLAVTAISYLLWSNARITQNYRQARINESKLLASESISEFDAQDRLSALQNGLNALIGEDVNRPITDEGQFALSQASYAYHTPDINTMLESWRIDLTGDITSWIVSRDGKNLVCMDSTSLFHTYDLKTHREVCSFRILEEGIPFAPIEGRDGELVCFDGYDVIAADYLTGSERWRLSIEDRPEKEESSGGVSSSGKTIGGLSLSEDGELIAVNCSFCVFVLKTDGTPALLLPIPDLPEIEGWYITDLCWSPDGKQIAVKLMRRFAETAQYRIGIFDYDTSDFRLLEPSFPQINLFRFDGEGTFYLLGEYSADQSLTYEETTHLAGTLYQLMAFRDGEAVWNQSIPSLALDDHVSLSFFGTEEKQMVLTAGSFVYVFDDRGTLVSYTHVLREILKLLSYQPDGFTFISTEGEWGVCIPSILQCDLRKLFPEQLDSFDLVSGDGPMDACGIVLHSGNLCFFENLSDESAEFFGGKGFAIQPDNILRSGSHLMLLSDRTVSLYDLNSRDIEQRISLSEEDAVHPLTAIDGTAYLLLIKGETKAFAVLAMDMESGAVIREDVLPVTEYHVQNEICTSPFSRADAFYLNYWYNPVSPVTVQGEWLYLHSLEDSSRIWKYHLTDGEISVMDLTQALGDELVLQYPENSFLLPSPLAVSPDRRYVFSGAYDRSTGARAALLIRTEDESILRLPYAPDDLSSVCFTESGVVYSGSQELYACGFDGELLYRIPYAGDAPISFAEHQGKIFCVYPNRRLVIYDGGEEIRSLPLSFDLSFDVVNGKNFRYEFSPSRLYLYCMDNLNVISLDSDGTTAVYYADQVLGHLEDTQELLVSSFKKDALSEGNSDYWLAAFKEYAVSELIERAQEQIEAFRPQRAMES